MAYSLTCQGKDDKAKKYYEKALELDPTLYDKAYAHFCLSSSYPLAPMTLPHCIIISTIESKN